MTDPAPALPEGLTTRPLRRGESKTLFDLIASQERHDTGRVDIEEADLVSDWALPGYDLGRARGATVIGMPVPEGTTIATRELPEGYAVREATPADYPALHDVLEDAFLEWSERDRESFEAFTAMVVQRPGFAPWNARVVTEPDGTVAAAAIVHLSETGTAYIARLGTRRDQRSRGIAQSLLVDSFAAGREHGGVVSELNTDSRTGALSLYEKVGMVVHSVWVNRAIEL